MNATSPLTPAPTDVRVMNATAVLLVFGLVVVALAFSLRAVLRQPVFALRAIEVAGDVERNSAASLRANALPRLQGSFWSLNLPEARAAFEAAPWVRHARVRRVWPMKLQVQLEEHHAAAYWELRGDGAEPEAGSSRALVNTFGEVFQANTGDVEDEPLPTLSGPPGTAPQMLRMWQQLSSQLRDLGEGAEGLERIERLELSSRGSWRAQFAGDAEIEIGRGSDAEIEARVARFVQTLPQITSRYRTALLSADLRHQDGYAVRLRGVSTQTPSTRPGKPAKQNH
ncbi:cell division protein FtsQ/DivIB [Roseateles sp.]|uniref:cell division protein FtsQ/DivIB n=1 Tax=Roseateles sp. TaxID=1971397 RepID=UPI00392134EE